MKLLLYSTLFSLHTLLWYRFLLLCFGARKTNSGVRRNVSKIHLKHHWKGSMLMWITGKPQLKEKTSDGVSLWIVRLNLSQIESRRLRIKGNFTSPKPTITRPEASPRILFVLCVKNYSMHELDSLVICAPINLRYSLTVIMVINFIDKQRRKFRCLEVVAKCISQIVASFLLILKEKLSLYTCDSTKPPTNHIIQGGSQKLQFNNKGANKR